MSQSLLVPPEGAREDRIRLSDRAIHDLDLHSIATGMRHRGISEHALLSVLTELPQNPDEIVYRQETTRCLWNNPDLCDELELLVATMQELTVFARSGMETDRPLMEAIWRLGELELYVELVGKMRETLEKADALSAGLQGILDELCVREADPAFRELARELPKLRAGIKLHQSVTIGVNLDDKLRPVEAALVGINERKYREGQFLSGFLGKATGNPFVTQIPLSRTPTSDIVSGGTMERLPLAPLFEELESVLKSMLRPLSRQLRSYVSVNTDLFRRLFPEVAFFLGAIAFFRPIARVGYAACFPEILRADHRTTAFRGLYNLRLASHWTSTQGVRRMVGNDAVFDDDARLFVLTGPNGGGKTTFTQAVGIASVLGQAGLPVPAAGATISPLDSIHTHFPTEEEFDDELGRFEDEARRISGLFDRVTRHGMVLLNEPLASTGPREAERIAGDVLSGLCLAGVRGIFTTHFHELARTAPQINEELERAPSAVGTLNAGVCYREGQACRTYEISSGPPSGSSFAEDVARRYEIDRESLERRIRAAESGSERDRA